MKLIKYLVITVVVVVVVFIAGAVVLVTTFDPNNYKDQIVTAAKEATGRDLALSGDIGFTFFPKLGVKLGQASLSNAEGFGDQEFASVDKISVSVDLLALLSAQVKADTIELRGLNVNLQKNKNGITNWDDLAGTSSSSEPATESTASNEAPAVGLEVAGIRITDSQIVYADQQAGNTITLNPIDIRTGSIGSGKPSSIELQLGMVQTNPPMTADINLNTDARLNIETAVYQLTNLVLDIKAKGDDLPEGEVALALKTNMDADLNNESLKLAPVEIEVAGLKLDGDLRVQSFSKPKISFSLHSDELNLDELIPASNDTTMSPETSADAVVEKNSDDKIDLPVDAMRSLNLDGSLNVGTLIVSGLTMNDLAATVTAKDGVINLNPLSINLYEGTYLGSAGVNVKAATPTYTASSELKNLAVAGLLEDLSEDGKSIIRGQSEFAFKVTTAGDRVSTLKKRLNGTANFKASNGALQSEKLARNIEKVIAFLKGREPAPAGEELVFDSLSGSAKITNGVAKNSDMKLITPLIYADGAGDINIGEEQLDYQLEVGLSDEPDRAAIPLAIKGSFEDPKYGIDFDAALKAKKDELIEEKKEEIQEKIDEKIKDKLGDKVGDKLKGLKLF